MGTSDFNRLNNHLGMLSDSMRPVDLDRQVDDTLRRWPTLAMAYEAMSASRGRKHELCQEQEKFVLDSNDAIDSREPTAS